MADKESALTNIVRRTFSGNMTPEIQREIDEWNESAQAARVNEWCREQIRRFIYADAKLADEHWDNERSIKAFEEEYLGIMKNTPHALEDKIRLASIEWAIIEVFWSELPSLPSE